MQTLNWINAQNTIPCVRVSPINSGWTSTALNASFPCLKNFLCVRKNNEDILLYHSNLTHKKAL